MTTTPATRQDRAPVLSVSSMNPSEVLVTGPEALRGWREENRCEVPGARFTPRFKRGQWDGTWQPGSWCREVAPATWEMRCSRGYLGTLRDAGFEFDLAGLLRPSFRPWSPEAEAVARRLQGKPSLRDYQLKAIDEINRRQWGRIALATNAGKGVVIALLAHHLSEHRVLVLCDEIAVFEALEGEIEKWGGFEPAKVESGVDGPPEGDVVLAMVPTLARRLKVNREDWGPWVSTFGALLLDEADKATAATWKRILRAAKHSHYRAGFSGTFPDDLYGDLLLTELMGPVLVEARNIELVERGISARPQVRLVRYDAASALVGRPGGGVWWEEMSGPERRRWVYERAIVNNPDRHDFVHSLIRDDTPTAIIVNRIAHGEALNETIPDSVFLDGSTSKTFRDEALRDFRDGLYPVLIATRIFDRGTNRLGHASDLIFASGEGSNRQTLQRIGRGLRRTDGKEFLRLVDVVDSGHRYLHKAARKRVALYTEEEFDVEIQA